MKKKIYAVALAAMLALSMNVFAGTDTKNSSCDIKDKTCCKEECDKSKCEKKCEKDQKKCDKKQ